MFRAPAVLTSLLFVLASSSPAQIAFSIPPALAAADPRAAVTALDAPSSTLAAERADETGVAFSASDTSESAMMSDQFSSSKPSDLRASSLASAAIILPKKNEQNFHWRRALMESGLFLALEQGTTISTDHWERFEITHGKFFQDWVNSIKGIHHWDDGDPMLDNYVGHPMQGAISGYIQIQNDPVGSRVQFSNTKAYWKSRLKAMAWNAAYSTQFEIGPLSEASLNNLGSYYYQNCAKCPLVNGAGYVDLVITPVLGTAWIVGEDALDRYVVQRLFEKHGRSRWGNLFRCALNPNRTAANMLHGKAPWYRSNRDDVH